MSISNIRASVHIVPVESSEGTEEWRVHSGGTNLGSIRRDEDGVWWREVGDGWQRGGDNARTSLASVVVESSVDLFAGTVFSEDELVLHIPASLRKGQLRNDPARAIDRAIATLDYLVHELLGRTYDGLRILDFGCGVNFTQALLQYAKPIATYTGLDVDGEMIAELSERVSDDRFDFHHVDFRNAKYNDSGLDSMEPDSLLPCGDISADVITMQSVVTHFAPEDVRASLAMLRNYVSDDGCLFFTCFVDSEQEVDFIDLHPNQPLLRAQFSEEFMRRAISDAGWKVAMLRGRGNPGFLPDHFLCHPI